MLLPSLSLPLRFISLTRANMESDSLADTRMRQIYDDLDIELVPTMVGSHTSIYMLSIQLLSLRLPWLFMVCVEFLNMRPFSNQLFLEVHILCYMEYVFTS